MLNVKLQRRFISLYVLYDLIKGKYVLTKAEKNPQYWMIAQQKSIKKFVKHIYKIPFYRQKFDAVGILPKDIKTAEDFLKLPILTKEEYRRWILEKTENKDEFLHWINTRTTGSTGTPLVLFSLPRDRAAEIANLFRCALLQKKHYHVLKDRVFSTMVPKPKASKIFSIPYIKQMSSISTAEELVAGYNATKPDFYYGNKTAILKIAQYALKNHIQLHSAKCVGSISEPLDNNARKIIEDAFGVGKVFDIYGCSECGNFAVEKCGEPEIHIVWSDTHVINIINETDVLDKPGYKMGQLAITSLIHYGFPVVNYVLGDIIEIKEEHGIKYITKILGRSNDVIKNIDGSIYQWMHVSRIMSGLTDIRQFRVIQKSYKKLVFVLAADKEISLKRKIEIERIISKRVIQYLGGTKEETRKEVMFEWCERIDPDQTGKVRMLISEV